MLNIAIYIILVFILLLLISLTYNFPALNKSEESLDEGDEKKAGISFFQGLIYTTIVLVIIGILV
ncbi:MAG: hypothetical protein ACR2KB_17900, partial [Chitinophagaceae bacterium]